MVRVVTLPVISALVGILILDQGFKGFMVLRAGTYLREPTGNHQARGEGRYDHCEPNKGAGTRQHCVITLGN